MKTIAALCMLIDHLGWACFPSDIGWRVIGRLAMPIFAYSVGRGACYTRSIQQYQHRLLKFALISQLPYWLLKWVVVGGDFFTVDFNIGFTFWLAVSIIHYFQKGCWKQPLTGIKKYSKLIGVIGYFIVADFFNMDYGSYGVLWTLACYYMIKEQKNDKMLYFIYTFLTYVYYGVQPMSFLLQEVGIIGLMIVSLLKDTSEKRWGLLFYIFYPLHMVCIALLKLTVF